jgi:prophage regulatory protein
VMLHFRARVRVGLQISSARLATMGRLLTGSDIGEKLGVSHQRAFQIVKKRDFPKPVACEGRSRLWRAQDVERWVSANPVVDVGDLEDGALGIRTVAIRVGEQPSSPLTPLLGSAR